MITVMGATGDTGREITRLLLDAGEEVRALGRSAPKLATLAGAGAEATRIIGERIGKPDLAYVQFTDAELALALVRAGFSEDTARLQVELNRALNEETIRSLEGRTTANTTPTRFEAFAAELARAYQEA